MDYVTLQRDRRIVKTLFGWFFTLILLACLIFGGVHGCTRNVDWVKERADSTATVNGFEIVGYEGYIWDIFYGGRVWYLLKRVPDVGIVYHAGFCRRPSTDEIHIVRLKAVDAIKP